jgi:hypothetical protein
MDKIGANFMATIKENIQKNLVPKTANLALPLC